MHRVWTGKCCSVLYYFSMKNQPSKCLFFARWIGLVSASTPLPQVEWEADHHSFAVRIGKEVAKIEDAQIQKEHAINAPSRV